MERFSENFDKKYGEREREFKLSLPQKQDGGVNSNPVGAIFKLTNGSCSELGAGNTMGFTQPVPNFRHRTIPMKASQWSAVQPLGRNLSLG